MYSKSFDITVTSASGIEKVLKSELKRLGYGEPPAENGAFTFKGDALAVARCNMNLRTADRVYITLKTFSALTFDQLFDGVYSIPFEEILVKDAKIIVNGNCVKSKLFAISACQSIVKKAIVKRLSDKLKLSTLPEDGEVYDIHFYIYKDVVSIRLNTSGVGLHKRGYRDMVGIAPIKETLASALLLMSDFYYKRPFVDPFCGSGTIMIEGARIALNIAPGRDRKFAFNNWENFDQKYYKLALEEAKDNEKLDRKLDFRGFDRDGKAIALSKHHAERAGVLDKIFLRTVPVKGLNLDAPFGTIVTNPPYGERVYDRKEAEECYKTLAERMKGKDGWSLFTITSAKNFQTVFGRKADRIRKLYNSEKECNYYYYYGKKEKE